MHKHKDTITEIVTHSYREHLFNLNDKQLQNHLLPKTSRALIRMQALLHVHSASAPRRDQQLSNFVTRGGVNMVGTPGGVVVKGSWSKGNKLSVGVKTTCVYYCQSYFNVNKPT